MTSPVTPAGMELLRQIAGVEHWSVPQTWKQLAAEESRTGPARVDYSKLARELLQARKENRR